MYFEEKLCVSVLTLTVAVDCSIVHCPVKRINGDCYRVFLRDAFFSCLHFCQ